MKRNMCKRCCVLLIPGVTAIVRTRSKIHSKMIGCTLKGSNFAFFIFVSILNRGQLLICSHRSKFFPIREDSFWKDFIFLGSIQEATKVVPLSKTVEKHRGISMHPK